MGAIRNRTLAEQERGWGSVGEKYVCLDCLIDEYLRRLLYKSAVRPGGVCCGLFIDAKECAGMGDENAPNAKLIFARSSVGP